MRREEVAVILPALDEEGSVNSVVAGFQDQGARVVVVDNGSEDMTSSRAQEAGAEVVYEPQRGYGNACLAGLAYLRGKTPRFVVFADCDGTVDPADLPGLLAPLREERADLVMGVRVPTDPKALPIHQSLGNRAGCLTLGVTTGVHLRDISPYRAIRWNLVRDLRLSEPGYGLVVETIVRAGRLGARISQIPIHYHSRIAGKSKVAGRPLAVVRAVWGMGSALLRATLREAA